MIGALAQHTRPLNAKSAGTLERDGFRIEKIIFESLPAFYVTANLYLPAAGAGPFPAVVMTPGHSPTGKAGEYQLAANFARNGIAALAYDPMSEGERLQYLDPATGKSAVGGPTGEHSQAALADDLTGEHISRYFVWDAMRAIDYLTAPQRYRRAAHRRLRVLRRRHRHRLPHRARPAREGRRHRLLHHRVPGSAGRAHRRAGGRADHPRLHRRRFRFRRLGGTRRSAPLRHRLHHQRHVPLSKARARTYEEAKRIYGLYGAADQLHWITGPGGHGALTPVHPEILAFFSRALKNSAEPPTYTRLTPDKPADLNCTPTGQVASSLHGETIASLIRKVRPDQVPRGFPQPRRHHRPPQRLRARRHARSPFILHSEPGVDLPGRLIVPPSTTRKPAVLLLSGDVPDGTCGLRRRRARAAASPFTRRHGSRQVAPAGRLLPAFAARRTGRQDPPRHARRRYHPRRGLPRRTPRRGRPSITVYGKGGAGVALLHAAALDRRITPRRHRRHPRLFRAILDEPLHRNAPEIVIPGVLTHYDIPDLVKAIAPRPVNIPKFSTSARPATRVERAIRCPRPAWNSAQSPKRYADGEQTVEVLHDISLAAEAGTVTALLGRSGCGKTTLLNLAGAMDFPTAGEVLIDGRATAPLSESELTALRRNANRLRLSVLPTPAHAHRAGECRAAAAARRRRQDPRNRARPPRLGRARR